MKKKMYYYYSYQFYYFAAINFHFAKTDISERWHWQRNGN